MRLFLSPTSPFARKVKVALIEKGLFDATEEVWVDPWASPDELLAVNPLSQVPVLEVDDGQVLTNSDTIIQWLERACPEPALLPADNAECARVLGIAALAHGVIESVVSVVLESRKPVPHRDEKMLARRKAGIGRTLDVLEERFDDAQERFQLDGLNVACALEYVDLRLPDFGWRQVHPRLAGWHEWAALRPSLQRSAPPAQ